MRYDQNSDSTGELFHKYACVVTVPDYVKKASSEELKTNTYKPVYAEPFKKLFPCHTKAATWTSTLFYLNNQKKYKKTAQKIILDNIEKYASYFGITDDINKLCTDFTQEKIGGTIADEDFAVIIKEGSDKETVRLYPVRNSKEAVKAAEWLLQHRDEIPFYHKHALAKKILSKQASLDENTEDTLNVMAGNGSRASCDVLEELKKRQKYAKHIDDETYSTYSNLVETFEQNPIDIRDSSTKIKLAAHLDSFDKYTKLNIYYDQELSRPEELLFGITTKKAQEVTNNYLQLTSGTIYKKADLNRVSTDSVKDYFGDEFLDLVSDDGIFVSVDKLASLAQTLPRNDAEKFEQMIKAAGVFPEVKELI